MMLAIPIISDIWNGVSGLFSKFAGWALDGVISVITTWVIGGVLALIEAIWSVIDTSSRPQPAAEWFSGDPTSPYIMATKIGAAMVFITVLLAVIRGVWAGSPGAIGRTVGHDLPLAVFAMVATVGFTQLALDVSDAMSDWVWDMTRDDAKQAMENLSKVLMKGLPGTHFLGVFLAIVLLLAMLFLWVVLFVRGSLIYLVIVFAAAFAWPSMIFAPLRDTAKKSLELLVALIIAKPVIALAMSVGISALGGLGATGEPGDGTGENMARELGTLVMGVIAFGLAAFMPFLVWRMMPLVAAAVVAQGVASAPMRGFQTGMQMQYYTQGAITRLSSGGASSQVGAARQIPASGWAASSADPARTPTSATTTDRLAGAGR